MTNLLKECKRDLKEKMIELEEVKRWGTQEEIEELEDIIETLKEQIQELSK